MRLFAPDLKVWVAMIQYSGSLRDVLLTVGKTVRESSHYIV